jgi:hypothetical protein
MLGVHNNHCPRHRDEQGASPVNSMIDADILGKQFEARVLEMTRELASKAAALVNSGHAVDLDRMMREGVHVLGERLCAETINQVGRALRDRPHACECCGSSMRFKQYRPIEVRTALTGEAITVLSPQFVCDACHRGTLAVREALRLDEDGFTQLLRELAVRAGTLEPFESAAEEVLGKVAGVTVSGSKIHTLCQAAGEVAKALEEGGTLGEARRLLPGEKLYIEIDGGMLHIDKDWHEAKVAIAFPARSVAQVSKHRREITHRSVCATLGTREDLGPLVLAMITPYLPKTADGAPILRGHVVVLGDGSVWIRNLVEESLPGARMILDWYHAVEHVAATALALYPDDEKVRKRWRARQIGLLQRCELDTLLRRLSDTCMRLPAGSQAQEAVAGLHNYLDERRPLLSYVRARREGLLIGSGAIESAIGHVLQQRMKRSGMHWRQNGADSMAALRCAYRTTGGIQRLFDAIQEAA